MGYHIILKIDCTLKSEYGGDFPLLDILHNADLAKDVPEYGQWILDIWPYLDICSFYGLYIIDNILSIHIEKKPHHHSGNLRSDYSLAGE